MKNFQSIEYEEHQRDYTLLGNSATFTFCMGKEIEDYFRYQPCPMYVCKKDGLFFHYYAKNDSRNRAEGWRQIYSIEELQKKCKDIEPTLKQIRVFYDSDHADLLSSIKKIYDGYKEVLVLSLITTEVPEYTDTSKEFIDLCFDARKKMEFVFKEGESLGKELIEKVEKSLRLEPGTIGDLSYREFLEFSSSRVLPKNMENRKSFVLIKITKDEDEIFYNRESLKEINIPVNNTDPSVIQGVAASKGSVVGRVKIIRSLEDSQKVDQGDIIVASMTDPRYLSVMHKAAAFVTDEGGITCHAAIVARELKKPCVIGTKNATKVLKDGDMVEVDADKGIIKILSN